MDFIIVGEDPVTIAIIKKLITEYCPNARISREEPIRGGKIQAAMLKYNQLAETYPVFVLTDEDGQCAPDKIQSWFAGNKIAKNMLFRIAVDEAESWLMADRPGFAKFFKIAKTEMPQARVRGKEKEVTFSLNYKSSLYIMHYLVPKSRLASVKEKLTPKNASKKGPAYNSAIVPFVIKKWNPEIARCNSSSLDRAIVRLVEFCL